MAPAAFNLSDSLIDDSPQKWFISAACVVRVATARVFTVERSMRSNRSETNNATVDAKIKKKSPFTINKQKIPPSKAPIESSMQEVEQVGCVLNCAGYSRHESLAIPSLGYLIVSSP